jgi:hypothetical protein
MAVANTLTYYDTATITTVKSFTVQASGVQETAVNFKLKNVETIWIV